MRHPFLRSAGSELKDPNFKNVTLLLHGDGTNGGQNNTFVDGSTNNFTITRNGNTTQGTFSPYGDNWSNFFDGTGDYLTVPDNAAFDFGTGDFTIELWVYIAGNSALNNNSTRDTTVVASFPTTIQTLTNSWGLNISGSGTTTGTGISFSNWQSGSNSVISATVTVPQNSWNHIAVARLGTTTKLFLNGAEVGSGTLSNQTVNSGQNLAVGRLGYPGYIQELNGYISNLRVLKGTAQYTGSYTIPTAPLTAITNTSLLTCSTNRFRDASTNNFTITRNGDVSVQRFSPFSPTAAYAAGTIGGSGYFDGTGDCLVTPADTAFQLGTGDFSVELWYYATTSATSGRALFGIGSDASGAIQLLTKWPFSGQPDNRLFLNATNGPQLATDTVFAINSWNHIALSRASGTVSIYLNGTRVGNGSFTQNITANQLVIGRSHTAKDQEYVAGYISNFRLVKGTALYSGTTITVPTAPLTAITDTQLLCTFTNAAILDNAMMAVPETVGNAQIDTTTKKYGTGSMKFDGTGDYLSIPPTSEFEFGTGDFTVECWFYASTVSGGEIPVYKQHGGVDAICEIRISSSKIYGKTATDQTVGAGTTTLSTNTWYHVAFVKSSNVYSLYLNGVSEGGTVTNATRINRPTTVRVGGNQTAVFFFTGYIDDLRVTKGVARYTANFTPPTAPFPNL